MTKLIMCVGIPGSGKSFWARQQLDAHTVEINRDQIREKMGINKSEPFNPITEKEILFHRNKLISSNLSKGKSVICSDMNLYVWDKKELKNLAKRYGASFRVVLFNIPLEICIERDSKREYPVGETRIRDYYLNFLSAKDRLQNETWVVLEYMRNI